MAFVERDFWIREDMMVSTTSWQPEYGGTFTYEGTWETRGIYGR